MPLLRTAVPLLLAIVAAAGLASERNFSDPCANVGGERLANITRTAPRCFSSCVEVCLPMSRLLSLWERNASMEDMVRAVCLADPLFRCLYYPQHVEACQGFLNNASRFGLPATARGLVQQCATPGNTTTTTTATPPANTTTTSANTTTTSSPTNTTTSAPTNTTTTLAPANTTTTRASDIRTTTTTAASFSCRRSRRASTWKVAAGAATLASAGGLMA
mmetsp:Transcript_55400/g.140093  ORF Transcript_55400/g.140093 Transcript_55400/m.140093 type:complete len:219 (+) Transcript_55400:100-756(+)